MKVNLGDKVKDRISGFSGIATARYEYLYGCVRISVSPDATDKDGKIVEPHVFDEDQLDVKKPAAVKAGPSSGVATGGPRPNPPAREGDRR